MDELAAVVGVKTEDAEGELDQQVGQCRLETGFVDLGNGDEDLPLRDLVDGVDVTDAFAARGIALMHGVDLQEAGPALGIGSPPLADDHRRGPGRGIGEAPLAVARLPAQVIQMGHRDRREPRELRLAVLEVFAFEDAPCGRPAERLVRFIHSRRQRHVGLAAALRETMPSVAARPHRAGGLKARDQPRHLRPARPGDHAQLMPQQTAHHPPLSVILLLPQHHLHPAANPLSVFSDKPQAVAGFQKGPDLPRSQFLCSVHAGHLSPACPVPSGSFENGLHFHPPLRPARS